ncbi:hypothetical protein BDR06DRAFT_984800 [Suillus hirtellus]|nr:hypothetical protein BDR06DRAFT_984800 [Suillus hirtellus]
MSETVSDEGRVLNARPKLSHAPQLHLLPEWGMHAPDKFLRKHCVSPAVFNKLIEHIQPHAIFYNNSNNPQLPIPIQLAIFLNGIGHYGNAATTQDLAEWAGVSEERKRAQQWVEGRTCQEWCGGFLCVNGTPFNLFQKPGWHGEGFFDKNSNYSLTTQVVILLHNLCIVDYVIGIPGSLHNSNIFGQTRWLWADSAYASQVWCVTPFK